MPIVRAKILAHTIDTAMRDNRRMWEELAERWLEELRDDRLTYPGPKLKRSLPLSQLADKCARRLFYRAERAPRMRPSPREIRLFHRGHLEECRVLAMLQLVGVNIDAQVLVQDGNIVGFADGLIDGVHDVPNEQMLLEIKTHSDARFKILKRSGVRAHFPEHSGQMDVGMERLDVDYGLYVGVNKNDDHLHLEILKRDSFRAQALLDRGHRILEMTDAPPRVEGDIDRFPCKFCDWRNYCWVENDD